MSQFFNHNIRKSRSLANLHQPSMEDLRSKSTAALPALPPQQMYTPPRRPQLKLNKTSIPEDDGASISRRWANSPNLRSSRTPSPPSRPKPAPRLWEDEQERHYLLDGMETPIRPSPSASPETKMGAFTPQRNTPSPSRQLPLRSYTTAGKLSTVPPRRPLPAVAELQGVSHMTPVQEKPESPEFIVSPMMRKMSDPTYDLDGPRSPVPRRSFSSDNLAANIPAEDKDTMKMMTIAERNERRASSMLLPDGLAPLVIPNSPRVPASKYQAFSPEDVKPPVPPKSPRTLNRAMPNKPGMPPMPSYHSPSGSIVSHAPSQPTPISAHINSFEIMSPSELPITSIPGSYPSSVSPAPSLWSDGTMASRPSPSPLQSRHQLSHNYSFRALHQQNSFSFDSKLMDLPARSVPEAPAASHQRTASDSVINRGRPKKQGDAIRSDISRNLKMAYINDTIDELPTGYSAAQATSRIPRDNLVTIRENVEVQASSFEIISEKDVLALQKELEELNDHCSQIRQTMISLRDGRRTLHEKLTNYLRAPGNALVPRENVAKQDLALSELDASIDEWTTKLESAQDRRSMVQRKIHEHMCAVLSLRLPGSGASEEQTPPRSPEPETPADSPSKSEPSPKTVGSADEDDQFDEQLLLPSTYKKSRRFTRAEVESIRIYADSGVASLLASIDQEIDEMDRLQEV